MSFINKENKDTFSQKEKSIQILSSQSISLFPEETKTKDENDNIPQNKFIIKDSIKEANNNDPYERLKIIEESINNKNKELKKINNKLNKINKIEKEIQKPLTFSQKQEIVEDNKIKDILNSNNISLGRKLIKISATAKNIESLILFGGHHNINYIPNKQKLTEIKNKKEYILLKIKENDNEIKKIDEKDIKNTYKQKQQIFLENLEKKSNNYNSNKNIIKKNTLLLTDNNINANEVFNKCLYEEGIQERINYDKIK